MTGRIRRVISIKIFLLNIGIIITTIMIFLSIFYFFNGSLEMYPNHEQIEKAKTSALIITSICIITNIVLIRTKIRYWKRNNK